MRRAGLPASHRGPAGLGRWARHDVGLYIAAAGASLVGALLVWSSTAGSNGTAYLVRHLLTAGVGFALALVLSSWGESRIRVIAAWVYGLSILGLVAVLTPLGVTVNGSRSWIPLLGGFTIQPAEIAKVGLCLALAALLAGRVDRGDPPGHRQVLAAAALVALPAGLVLLQPDLGSAAVILALGFVVVTVSGAPRVWVLGSLAVAASLVVVALSTDLLSAYQKDRLTAFADPSADPQGLGYQTRQVRLAIGSGGWWGEGFMSGERTQGGSIPYQLNDFVFSVAGEELGFVGSVGLLLLLGFVVARVFVVAARAGSTFGRLVAVGVGAWLAVQVVQNVGMNLGLLPVTGLPLPFISYGGSSMLVSWAAIGLADSAHTAGSQR